MKDIIVTTVRLPRQVNERLERVALQTGCDKTNLIRMSISQFLRGWDDETKP